jgi:hypothetical protein
MCCRGFSAHFWHKPHGDGTGGHVKLPAASRTIAPPWKHTPSRAAVSSLPSPHPFSTLSPTNVLAIAVGHDVHANRCCRIHHSIGGSDVQTRYFNEMYVDCYLFGCNSCRGRKGRALSNIYGILQD